MALTGTDRGTGNHNTGATTLVVTPGSNLTAGALAVLWVSYDNTGTSGADPWTAITDSVGNTWFPRVAVLNDPGAAAAGVCLREFISYMDVATLTTGNTITVTFGAFSVVAKTWTLMEVTAAAGSHVGVRTQAGAAATGTTTAPTITTVSITSGDMVIGGVGAESGTTQTFTGDGDSTNGSWSTQQTNKIGSTTSGTGITTQRKVTTGTATQTYNPTLGIASDHTIGYDIFTEEANAADFADDFSGSGTDSWPNADTGGAYTLTGTAADFDEGSGAATVTLGASGATHVAALASVAQLTQDIEVKFKADKLPSSGGSPALTISVVGRYVDASNYYWTKVIIESSGTMRIECDRRVAGADASVSSLVSTGTYSAGDVYHVRMQAIGLSPTQLLGKFWKDGDTAPAWQVSGADSSAALQVTDGVGVRVDHDAITDNPLVVSFLSLVDYWAPRSTNASAGAATATGSAPTAADKVAAQAGVGTETGTAPTPTVTLSGASTNANAGVASGTGSAAAAAAKVSPAPGASLTTGTAATPATKGAVPAGVSTAVATAAAPVAKVAPSPAASVATGTAATAHGAAAPSAGVSTATGSSPTAAAAVAAPAGLSSSTGTAPTPTVDLGGAATNANAGLSSAGGSALAPAASVAAPAGTATATATALDAAAGVKPAPGVSSSTGTAPSAHGGSSAAAGVSTAVATALDATVRLGAAAGVAAGTAIAWGPSVNTSGGTNAQAGLASATGSAPGPHVAILVAAAEAKATGRAYNQPREGGITFVAAHATHQIPYANAAATAPEGLVTDEAPHGHAVEDTP